MPTIDLAQDGLRALNKTLQKAARDVAETQSNETDWTIENPKGCPRDCGWLGRPD